MASALSQGWLGTSIHMRKLWSQESRERHATIIFLVGGEGEGKGRMMASCEALQRLQCSCWR